MTETVAVTVVDAAAIGAALEEVAVDRVDRAADRAVPEVPAALADASKEAIAQPAAPGSLTQII